MVLSALRSVIAKQISKLLVLPSKPPFGSVDRLTYTRNWLAYLSLTQATLLGEEFPSAGQGAVAIYPRDQCVDWDVESLRPGRATEHAVQRGLWIIPKALDCAQCADAIMSIAALTGDAVQGHGETAVQPRVLPGAPAGQQLATALKSWPWFEYERARWMVPLQPSPGIDPKFALTLRTLQSHGCTDAHTWPLLSAVVGIGGDLLRHIESLPGMCIACFERRTPLFLQVQALQRG